MLSVKHDLLSANVYYFKTYRTFRHFWFVLGSRARVCVCVSMPPVSLSFGDLAIVEAVLKFVFPLP